MIATVFHGRECIQENVPKMCLTTNGQLIPKQYQTVDQQFQIRVVEDKSEGL